MKNVSINTRVVSSSGAGLAIGRYSQRLALWIVLAIMGLFVGHALATPYASCITNNAGTIQFYLNESNATVCVTYEDGSTNASFDGINTGTNLEYQRAAVWSEMNLYRIEDGRIVESWSVGDELSLMKQLGYTLREPEKLLV